jgi:hypothetical protein
MKIRKIIFGTAMSALVCFGLCQQVQSATDTPDPGSLPTSNTADGQGALGSLTTGLYNSAFGFLSVLSLSDANFDTGVGAGALLVDNGGENTAVGAGALFSNTTGANNTAVGTFALFNNTAGPFNTAVGWQALMNLTGSTAANANAAFGDLALQNVSTGFFNTAIGAAAGINQTTGNNNIYIGQGSFGVAGESHTCYIQEIAGATIPTANAAFVFVDTTTGQLATVLADANGNRVTVPISQSQLQAAPQDQPKAVPQRSGVSEDGHPQAMLNLKVEKLQATVAQQHKQIEALTAQLKDQVAQIQKVSAQVEVNKPAPRVVVNKP